MEENTRTIELTAGQVAIVDAEDYEKLSQHKWQVQKDHTTCYARRKQNGRNISMHREILEAPPDLCCDHKNHNGLDNRKSNLRLCTHAQNCYNSRPHADSYSKYKGVSWCSETRKWKAQIEHNGRNIHIGYFDYEADAALAYDDYALELFGEFAYLNHQNRPEIQKWLEESYLFETICC